MPQLKLKSKYFYIQLTLTNFDLNFLHHKNHCKEAFLILIQPGTINLRRRQILTIFDPYHPPSAVIIRQQIWTIFDPCPLKNANVLNEWSLIGTWRARCWALLVTQVNSNYKEWYYWVIAIILLTNIQFRKL